MRGEKIYEYDLDVTGVTDYGVTLETILSGEARIPPQGARIDVAFEGRATGRLTGRVRGIDYLRIRDYAWVNTRQVWGLGTVNFAVGKIHIDGAVERSTA